MRTHCPTCGQPVSVELPEIIREWRDRLETAGHWVSVDNRVTPATAAALLNRSPATLANWRSQQIGPAFIRGRSITYDLYSLARYALENE